MDESDENNRGRWNNNEVDKCFLESCIQEVALNGREGGSLKAESWTKVMKALKNNYNFVVSQRQMKNRYDYLKQKYQAWLPLTTKTCNVYNHATNTINMTKDEALFDGTTATGVHSWGPSSQDPNPSTSSFSSTVQNAEQNNIEDILCGDEDQYFVHTTETQSNDSNRQSQGEKSKKKKKKIQHSSSDNNLVEEMSAALKFMIKNNSGPSVTDCIAKLDELGWDKEDILYVSAVVKYANIRDYDIDDDLLGAVGALDGTLVHAIVPISKQNMYRGWEGVTHDSRVLTETIADPRNGFPWPPAGDYRRRRALTKEEKFNHAHAQLRNVIERTYGVLKNRFPILETMAPFSFDVQRNIVIACFAVHNFIRKERISDRFFEELYQPNVPFDGANEDGKDHENDGTTTGPWWGEEDMQYMANVRDEIATRLMH
ncbi:PREDICTED: uncharacterized protein LOC105954568 [Erythranthe guttata]|uniref:uncharacterized protein LOC105954568 n=1 Tax=Erythranthe guttata TaxID=4155 RepID=UPI00064DE311|nr:PREDICTED: uncharacterized protein LOC105954568 [Erythranthe guttata]|eukprot:XP_012833691.1 PREDICTED: uncharacterized protein LOC105954568 [Erythranthe guttata]